MGTVLCRQLPCRKPLPIAAAQMSSRRCSQRIRCPAAPQEHRTAPHSFRSTHAGVEAPTSGTSGALPQPVRRGHQCRASSSDQKPSPTDPGSSIEPHEATLREKVAEFGKAIAQTEQEAFLAAQDELRRQREAQQQAQQAAGAQQPQGSQAASAQAGAAVAGAGAAAPAAAAFVGGAVTGASPAAAAAGKAQGNAAAGAAVSQSVNAPAAPAAAGSAGNVDMAAAVREKLARAAEYRKV